MHNALQIVTVETIAYVTTSTRTKNIRTKYLTLKEDPHRFHTVVVSSSLRSTFTPAYTAHVYLFQFFRFNFSRFPGLSRNAKRPRRDARSYGASTITGFPAAQGPMATCYHSPPSLRYLSLSLSLSLSPLTFPSLFPRRFSRSASPPILLSVLCILLPHDKY